MILWKQPFEITKEMKREKGHNYRARDIGPWKRLCNNCNKIEIEYPNYDSMNTAERLNVWCKNCVAGPKGKTGQYSRKCGNEDCKEIIFYKAIGDFKTGEAKNTKCQKCRNKDLSKYYKELGGLKGHLILKFGEEEGLRKWEAGEKKRIKSVVQFWEENPDKKDETTQKRVSARKKNKYAVSQQGKINQAKAQKQKYIDNPNLKTKISVAKKKWIKDNPERFAEIQLKSQEGYKNWFIVGNIKCQGSSEKSYIEYLIENNLAIPNKVKHKVDTSYGMYFPDFEFEDRYIEIKSTYTYKLLLTKNLKQYNKILETAKNIKPVEIIIINSKEKIINSELFQ